MFTSGLNSALDDLRGADQTASRIGQQLTTGRKIRSPQDDPSTWLEASRASATSTYLDAVRTGLSEVSTNLGTVDATMQAIGRHLQDMKGQLEKALSVPADDPSRTQYIANFNAIRDQIDGLVDTAPPAARSLMTSPAGDPAAGDIKVLTGLGQSRTVHAQAVDTGGAGLNLAPLDPAQVTDADLHDALASLATAQDTLANRQAALGVDEAAIRQYQNQTAETSGVYQAHTDALTSGDPAEASLELQSVELRHSLALQALASISNDRRALLGLLG